MTSQYQMTSVVNVLRQARISGVKLVTRFCSNFVVERFGKEYRKEDILRDIII